MAVHTPISKEELEEFLKLYDLGTLASFEGIAQGIENSNFHVFTDRGRFVLTLFEKRTPEKDLPFFLSFMEHQAAKGIPCPKPLPMREGGVLGRLSGKPAVLLEFMPGQSTKIPTPEQCSKIGVLLADMHNAAQDFTLTRENTLSLPIWQKLIEETCDQAPSLDNGLSSLEKELAHLKAQWPKDLPQGAIHADLFPDNILFDEHGGISGVLDFYFAATDLFVYDIALTFNAWCFNDKGEFLEENSNSFIDGYASRRNLFLDEEDALSLMGRAAATRIISTRLYDWFHTPPESLVTKKDPIPYLRILEFHREES